jgi:hypothetical protein
MQISLSPLLNITPVIPYKMATLNQEATFSPVQYPTTITEAQKHSFENQVGQRLIAEQSRIAFQRLNKKTNNKNTVSKKIWASFLFGEDNKNDQTDEEDNLPNLEFFGDNLFQGSINDCFLIAVLYTLIRNPHIGKAALADMIEPIGVFVPCNNPNDPVNFTLRTFFDVTFPGYADVSILVDPAELSLTAQVKGGVGFRILEYAFAKLSQKLLLCSSRPDAHLNQILGAINDGGRPAVTLHALTNKTPKIYSKKPEQLDAAYKSELGNLLGLVKHSPNQYMLWAVSGGEQGGFRDPEQRFPNWHIYSVEVCRDTQKITVVNPHNTKTLRHEVSTAELAQYFIEFILAEA